MIKMFENEDDYEFNPSDSAKLSSLFGSSAFQTEETSNILMYTAPKQPNISKSTNNTDKPLRTTKVIIIKVVSLWKSEDKTYKPMGKHGLAIIGSSDLKLYEIIAYKHKTNTILRAKIGSQFYFQERKDNFSSFNDSSSQNWLVRFDTSEQQSEFSEYIKSLGATVILQNSDDSSKTDQRPDILPKPDLSANDQDSDSSDSTKKAHILSRITKMGQQVVPKPLSVLESDVSDDYESSGNKNRKFRKVKKLEREESQSLPTTVSNQVVPKPLVSAPQVPVYYSQATYGDVNSLLLAQNSELRSGLNQISEKLDTLSLQRKGSNTSSISKLKVLELKTDNLQTELRRYKQKYSDLELKYANKFKAESTELDEKQLEISNLKDTITELNSKLKAAAVNMENLETLEKELEESKKDITEYQRIIETQKVSLEELDLFYQQYKNKTNDTAASIASLNEKLQDYELRLQKLELEKREMLQQNKENADVLAILLKQNMNSLYQSILNSFTEDASYTLSDMRTVLSKNLKDTSYQIIQDITSKLHNEKQNAE